MVEMRDRGALAGPGIMLLSAAIFGYFGWMTVNWYTPGVDGQVVPFRVLLGWTLRGSAIAFAGSALLTLAIPVAGNLLYSLVGLLGALLLVLVVVLDHLDKQHMAMSPFLLLLFAAWNGYGSWLGLRAVLAGRRVVGSRSPGF